jgi:HPt (histidine-containing phosphotransfer) domain-containing protein
MSEKNRLIDQETGLEICGSSLEIYHQILALMLEYEGENGQILFDNCRNQNWKAFGNEVHALKSSAAGIGAGALSEAALKMETAVDRSDYAYVQENQEAFFLLLKETISEIHSILDE